MPTLCPLTVFRVSTTPELIFENLMRIAEVSPLFESVPPKFYGGTERVIAYLTDELVRQGHEVTLFASGDSLTSAQLVAACPEALRLSKHFTDCGPLLMDRDRRCGARQAMRRASLVG